MVLPPMPTQSRVLVSLPKGGASGRSWGEEGMISMNEDVRQMLNALAEIAGPLLEEEGYFPPAGAMVLKDGEVRILQLPSASETDTDEDEDSPENQVEQLQEAFREAHREAQIRACAFSLDVHVEDPTTGEEHDAILVSAEIEGGEAFEIFLPYTADEEDEAEEVEILQPFATQRDPVIFV